MSRWWKFALLLAAIWLVAGLVIFAARAARPTPASLAAYIDAHPLDGRPPGERAKVIDRVADQLNKLNFDQRQELRRTKADRRLFSGMTPEEQRHFLDLTLPEGFRQLMIALNKMDPQRRQKIVQRALDDLDRETPAPEDRVDRALVQKMIAQGVDSFYSEANAEVKLEFAPVIEKLQRASQNAR